MNKSVLIGRLTKDPELRYTPNKGTAVVNGVIAVDRDGLKNANGEKIADFINFVAWGKTAENLTQYCSKGSLIGMEGRIETRTYDAKDGTKRYVTELNTRQIEFLSTNKNNAQPQQQQQGYAQPQQQQQGYAQPQQNQFGNFMPEDDLIPIDDGDIPF